jgi:hypothetical protein
MSEITTNDIIVWLESKRQEIPRTFYSIIEKQGKDQAKIRQKQLANEYHMLSIAIDKLHQSHTITGRTEVIPQHITPNEITNEILGLKRHTA